MYWLTNIRVCGKFISIVGITYFVGVWEVTKTVGGRVVVGKYLNFKRPF